MRQSHDNFPAAGQALVQFADRVLRFGFRAHLDKTKAAGASVIAKARDGDVHDGSEIRAMRAQEIFRPIKRKITDK